MKKEDLNKFKGEIKSALQQWGNNHIESLVPNRPTVRYVMKNYLNNVLNRFDNRMNGWIDNLFMAVAGVDGSVDSDMMVDTAIGIFKEIQPFEYRLGGGFSIEVGGGELIVNLPQNVLLDSLVGDLGRLRFTTDDLLEFKNLLN